MGRRALPKLDPRVTFSPWMIALPPDPKRLDVEDYFGRSAELEIEVGSGKGLFLLNAAVQWPERNFLGIEISLKYARFAAYRAAQRSLTNVRVVHADGVATFRDYLGDQIASAVHVYFPDPWWKARHRKRRLMQPTFVRDIDRVLKPGGTLHFWTDVEEYFQSACDLVRETVAWRAQPVGESVAQHDMDYRTHFERRMRRHDHPVFRGRFVKPPAS